jgi:hypothetical protein
MPKEYTDEELGLDPEEIKQLDPNIRRELRAARTTTKRYEESLDRQDRMERELAFFRAGIPGDDKGMYFAAGYSGDLSPTAIKAEYDRVFGQPLDPNDPNHPDNAGKTADELAAQKRIADAGGDTSGQTGILTLEDALKNAKDNKEVMEILRNAPPEAGIRVTDPY